MMYRNLEEDRKTKIEAASESARGTCDCTCGDSKAKDDAEKPAGNKTTVNLQVDWDINNK